MVFWFATQSQRVRPREGAVSKHSRHRRKRPGRRAPSSPSATRRYRSSGSWAVLAAYRIEQPRRRPHGAALAPQSAVQCRRAARVAARRQESRYVPLTRARRPAQAAAGFAERRLAQRELPRLRRLHADGGFAPARAPRRARTRTPHRDHVRRSRAVALPPLARRRRAHSCAASPSSRS